MSPSVLRSVTPSVDSSAAAPPPRPRRHRLPPLSSSNSSCRTTAPVPLRTSPSAWMTTTVTCRSATGTWSSWYVPQPYWTIPVEEHLANIEKLPLSLEGLPGRLYPVLRISRAFIFMALGTDSGNCRWLPDLGRGSFFDTALQCIIFFGQPKGRNIPAHYSCDVTPCTITIALNVSTLIEYGVWDFIQSPVCLIIHRLALAQS